MLAPSSACVTGGSGYSTFAPDSRISRSRTGPSARISASNCSGEVLGVASMPCSAIFSRRGLIAEYGISWILPRLVGLANANDILFSGRLVGAEEALRMGLVSRVIDDADFAGVLTWSQFDIDAKLMRRRDVAAVPHQK